MTMAMAMAMVVVSIHGGTGNFPMTFRNRDANKVAIPKLQQ